MTLSKNEFYSVKLRKTITIPSNKIRKTKRGSRNFLVGKYTVKGEVFEAWKITK